MNVRRHAPERRRTSVTLAAHGCCCCCCCCLHSIGGLVGSAVASTKAKTEDARRTVKLYWILFLVSLVVGLLSLGFSMREGAGVALIIGALCLPAAQWNASFLTLCASMFVAIDLRMLGQITWKGFLWALIGFLVMAVPTMALSWM